MTASTWTEERLTRVLSELGPMIDVGTPSDAAFDIAGLLDADYSDTPPDSLARHRRKPYRPGPRLAAMAAAAVVLAIVAVWSVAPARDAVANFFGIGSTQVEITDSEVTDREGGADTSIENPTLPAPTTAGDGTSLAEDQGESVEELAVTSGLEELARAEAVELLGSPLPQVVGASPVSIGTPPEGGVIQAFADGTTLWARGSAAPGGPFIKQASSASVTFLKSLGDGDALLISGPHGLSTPGRTVRSDSVVIWLQDGLELRLEGLLSDDELVETARNVNTGG